MDETPILEAKEDTAMNALCMMASLSSARNKPKRVISRINPTLKDTQSMTRVLTVWEFLKTIRFSTVWLSLMLMDVGFPMDFTCLVGNVEVAKVTCEYREKNILFDKADYVC